MRPPRLHLPKRVVIQNSQKDVPLSLPKTRRLISSVLGALGVRCNEVVVHFVTQRRIQELHAEFFDDPTPTDCISFSLDSPIATTSYSILGEVFVCPKVALAYATSHKLPLMEEVMRYVIHGLLHLVGYDDLKENERVKMRQMEDSLLREHFAQIFTTDLAC